jgi:hypothetical protein
MNKFRLSLLLLTTLLCATAVFAGQPIVWEIGSRAELLKGEARGVSITDTGVVTLAPNANEIFNTEQAYVWSSAVDSAGNVYLGTGHDGKLFRIGADGKGALLYKAAELDVTALAVGADGSLLRRPLRTAKSIATRPAKPRSILSQRKNTSGRWQF